MQFYIAYASEAILLPFINILHENVICNYSMTEVYSYHNNDNNNKYAQCAHCKYILYYIEKNRETERGNENESFLYSFKNTKHFT